MDTSKTSCIKSLLLQAWRERWTDVRWGINIKTVLPRGVSGDVYDLADCILQQALVGPGPNDLFLAYLTHCLSSQIVSYGAVFTSISRCECFEKPHCVVTLLDLIKNAQRRVVCHGNEEECIALCKSIVNLTLWLYNCTSHALKKSNDQKGNSDIGLYTSIMEAACECLSNFNKSVFFKCLLYIGKSEEANVYSQVIHKQLDVQSKLAQSTCTISKDTLESALSLIEQVESLAKPEMITNTGITFPNKGVPCSLSVVVFIEAILKSAHEVQTTADRFLAIQRLTRISLAELYSGIIRACFSGLVESAKPSDLKWCAFVFHKVPHVIALIAATQKRDPRQQIVAGFDLLFLYGPLLDLADTKLGLDAVQRLMNELKTLDLLGEDNVRELQVRREASRARAPSVAQSETQLLFMAEPTINKILGSLDSDYSKNPEPLLGVLNLTSKSFELILSAASATDKLSTFVKRLLRYNDAHNSMTVGDRWETRALLFDFTFLMLCRVAQLYGVDAVKNAVVSEDGTLPVFVQWLPECIATRERYVCPDKMIASANPERVELLLKQFMAGTFDLRACNFSKWSEVCVDLPAAMSQVLLAWEHGVLAIEHVKTILDNIKGRVCCLPVVVSSWLCCTINVLHHEECLKAINMLNQFAAPLASPQRSSSTDDGWPSNDFYAERSIMMSAIIRKMMYDLRPSPSPSNITSFSPILTDTTPIWETVDSLFTSGSLSQESLSSLDSLVSVCGIPWLVDSIVRRALQPNNHSELVRATDFAFGLFHVSMVSCALSLLRHVLPKYLALDVLVKTTTAPSMNNATNQMEEDVPNQTEVLSPLTEPKASALARLVALTVFAAMGTNTTKAGSAVGSSPLCQGVDLLEEPPWQRGRVAPLLGLGRRAQQRSIDSDSLDDTPFSLQHGFEATVARLKEQPIVRVLVDVLSLISDMAHEPDVTSGSLFPLLLFEQLVICGGSDASSVLQFLPLNVAPQLVHSLPQLISYPLLLALSSYGSSRARKVLARAACQLHIAKSMSLS